LVKGVLFVKGYIGEVKWLVFQLGQGGSSFVFPLIKSLMTRLNPSYRSLLMYEIEIKGKGDENEKK
jgi:hypothetical protein